MRTFCLADRHLAGGRKRVALARLEPALGVRGRAKDRIEVIEEGEAAERFDFIEGANRLLCLDRGGLDRLAERGLQG